MGDPEGVVAVIELHGLQWASQTHTVASKLGGRPGVLSIDANSVSQTATIRFDPKVTSIAELRAWVHDCGYHCSGRSVPNHVCDPLSLAPSPTRRDAVHHHEQHGQSLVGAPPSAQGHSEHAEPEAAVHEAHVMSPHDAMGHGGHGSMSMAGMVADMRRRFVVAAVFSVPILLWSPVGRDVLNFDVAAPFGLRDDVWMFLLSLPVVL